MRPLRVLGIDMGGTSVKAAVVDVKTLTCIADPVTVPTLASDGRKAILGQIALAAKRAMSNAGVHQKQLHGIGLASPGPLCTKRGMLLRPVNLKPLWFAPIAAVLGEALGAAVSLCNDANAAAYGEYKAMGDEDADVVMFTLGTGIGGGIISRGRILEGEFGNAGEFGHIVVDPSGPRCACGQHGCVEGFSSANAILRQARREPSITKSLPAGEPLTPKFVYQVMRGGNRQAERILDSACAHLARAVVVVQHTLNPKTVLLGGGLVDMSAYFVRQVGKHAKRLTWHAAADMPAIKRARLGNRAGLIGAAAWAWANACRM